MATIVPTTVLKINTLCNEQFCVTNTIFYYFVPFHRVVQVLWDLYHQVHPEIRRLIKRQAV